MAAASWYVGMALIMISTVCRSDAFAVLPVQGSVLLEPRTQIPAFTSSSSIDGKCQARRALIGFLCGAALVSNRRHVRQNANRHRPIQMCATRAAANIPEVAPLTLFSPAKVNLFLRIIRRRADGYHDLASLFHTVSLGDELTLELLPKTKECDELQCNVPGVPVDDSNLVIRALKLFRERSGIQRFFKVTLHKRTPAEAGMGGGSSNAATALYGANELCGRPAHLKDLLEWANDPIIGSDAAFFLSGGSAFCTGRGEIVTPVEQLPIDEDEPVYLIKPRYGLSTPKVFKALDLAKLNSEEPVDILQKFTTHGVSHDSWINDLEQPAFAVCPELGDLKRFLLREEWGFKSVLMSGSGTTIFCIGHPKKPAAEVEAATRQKFDIQVFTQAKFVRRTEDEWYK